MGIASILVFCYSTKYICERFHMCLLVHVYKSSLSYPPRSHWVIGFKNAQTCGDFPGGPGVKNLPSNAGVAGLIPVRGTKIPYAMGQLRPRATTREKPMCLNERSHVPQQRQDAAKNK